MKKIVSILMVLAMVLCMASCDAPAAEDSYTVGICQLVQHEALDAATEGFKEALFTLLEADGKSVEFIEQNASGDAATCVTICNQLVAEGVDLIMGNATPALQAAAAATAEIPIIGTSITDYATALEIADWSGKTGSNITGTADLAPLDEQAAMIQELFPDAKKVGILYCSAEANSVYQSDVISGYLTEMGYEVDGFKETQNIESISFALEENTLDVIFNVNDNFDAKEYVGYYHSAKIFKCVKAFAEFVGLEYKIFLNDKLWVDENGVKDL